MAREGLIYARSLFPPSLTLITAVALLIIGLLAIASMIYDCGPFG
jgi:putative membrane protein